MKTKNKGFLQFPIIIAFLVGSMIFGGTGFLLNQYSQKKNSEQAKVGTDTKAVKGSSEISKPEKIEVVAEISDISSAKDRKATNAFKEQEAGNDLKIAQCEASKNLSYNKAIASLDEKFTVVAKNLYDSLNSQMKQEINNIYSNTSYSSNGSTYLSGASKLLLTEKDSYYSSYQAELTIQKYQTEWSNKNIELDQIKQKGIADIKTIAEQEYLNCLKQ